eukprot:CAMPEP_0185329062 /NCGR_PEP_ID=MMETSP1363-20130426/74559_1 /TAXON_ID=38817 /ORGANISM="Gephyrocapsa oceanica, Strain RCC1303" /LENGTH=91 /DNA_ID=CAMNT_0027927869 /DNA_START=192 /DNA_END=464 /DNA_ORIENTATION=-
MKRPERKDFRGRLEDWIKAQNAWVEHVRRPNEKAMPDFDPSASPEADAVVRGLRADMWAVYSNRAGPPKEGSRRSQNAFVTKKELSIDVLT